MKAKVFYLLTLIPLFFSFLSPNTSLAKENNIPNLEPVKEESLEAIVINILEEKEVEKVGGKQLYQKLELEVTKGSLENKTIIVENGNISVANEQKYKLGDSLVISYSKDSSGNEIFYITDYIRRKPLFWLFLIFLLLSLIIARWKGLTSLLGLLISFFIIFKFILPSILKGASPVLTVMFASLFIIPITFYLSHGFNKKTTSAVIGTCISLITIGFLASIFVEKAKLTGFASEEAGFLQVMKQGSINIKGLLLSGIIIGVMGVLDDITISQAAIVQEIKNMDKKLSIGKIYTKAMRVGKDHIASMINTLILVYTGASLPLLLLFMDKSRSFWEIINFEIVADEVVRTLVGSTGLILAVPITTLIACLIIEKNESK